MNGTRGGGAAWKWHAVWVLALLLWSAPINQAQAFDSPTEYGSVVYSTKESDTLNGVTPDEGASGTEFTFRVTFRDDVSPSAPGVTPTSADLLIDLDGDGTVGGTVKQVRPSRALPWSVIALALLWAVLAWMAARIPNRAPALVRGAFTAALALAVIGCTGSSGGSANASHGGEALASCTSPTGEVVALTDTDPGGDYKAGIDFKTTLTLECEPGVLLYRFRFKYTTLTFNVGTAVNYHIITITP